MDSAHDGIVVTLLANGDEQAVVRKGEPIVLTVGAVDTASILLQNRNLVARLSRRQLAKDRKAGRGGHAEATISKPRVTTLGSERSPWVKNVRFYQVSAGKGRRLVWKTVELRHPSAPPIVTLDWAHSASVDFGLDPEELAKVRRGRYGIRASLRLRGHEIQSEDVFVELRASARGAALSGILALATYEYRRGRYVRALEQAVRAQRKAPSNIAVLVLRGDIESALGQYADALAHYERAYNEFRKQNPRPLEEPRSLLAKIADTRRKLGSRSSR